MRFTHTVVASGSLLLAITGCSGSGDDGSSAPTSTSASTAETTPDPAATPSATTSQLPPLTFKVEGRCTSAGGTLYGVGSGFTPGGTYITEVTQPDGKPYSGEMTAQGVASAQGTTPKWSWPCNYKGKGDPPGVYKVTIIDRETNRQVGTTFTINKP